MIVNDINGKLFVDATTVHPNTTKDTEERLKAHGASFVAGESALAGCRPQILMYNNSAGFRSNSGCREWHCLDGHGRLKYGR